MVITLENVENMFMEKKIIGDWFYLLFLSLQSKLGGKTANPEVDLFSFRLTTASDSLRIQVTQTPGGPQDRCHLSLLH